MVLSDWPKEPVDAIFFHGRGEGDHDGLFELALEFWRDGMHVVVNDFEGAQGMEWGGYQAPGSSFYVACLTRYGIPSGSIVCTRQCFHTNEENDAFIELAKERMWKRAVMISQPHQVLREFLGAIQSSKTYNYPMKLYAACPVVTLWFKDVFANISITESMERFRFSFKECERIFQYQQKGDLCTFEEFFEYMQNRYDTLRGIFLLYSLYG